MAAVDGHTIECVLIQWERQICHDNFFIEWPRTCQECQGTGFFCFNNYLGHGDYETVEEPCDCTFNGRCPRCGRIGLTTDGDGDGPCIFCWWDYFPGAPAVEYICFCYEFDAEGIKQKDKKWLER